MRGFGRILATAFSAALMLGASSGLAGSMDPALERLTVPCATAAGPGLCPDDDAFKRIANQYGMAFAPLAMYPARTTGYGGFQVTFQGAYTSIDSSADYWKNGTRGGADPSTGQASVKNGSPPSLLQVYGVNLRKGLPFGFELGGSLGAMVKTSLMSAGADFRWSPFEGFRSGVLGFFPDLAVAGGVRTVTGSAQLQLTIATFDAMLSKPIPVADSLVLTPYAGYQFVRIFGDSGAIDFSPNTDALSTCGYQGQNVPGTPGATPPYTGQPICSTAARDWNSSNVFHRARISRHRLVLGLMARYEMIVLGAHFMTDLTDPSSANSGDEAAALKGVPRQTTLGFQAGVAF